MSETDAIVMLVTAGTTEQGEALSRALVEERLAACVNLVPNVRSIYRWQGKVCDDREVLLVIKTRRALFSRVAERVKEIHIYEVPEIIALDVVEGSASYLGWLVRETS